MAIEPAETAHPPAAGVALGVALVLALVTGFVDAVAFARLVGVFPANGSPAARAMKSPCPEPEWRAQI
jgi:hypothetical protein